MSTLESRVAILEADVRMLLVGAGYEPPPPTIYAIHNQDDGKDGRRDVTFVLPVLDEAGKKAKEIFQRHERLAQIEQEIRAINLRLGALRGERERLRGAL